MITNSIALRADLLETKKGNGRAVFFPFMTPFSLPGSLFRPEISPSFHSLYTLCISSSCFLHIQWEPFLKTLLKFCLLPELAVHVSNLTSSGLLWNSEQLASAHSPGVNLQMEIGQSEMLLPKNSEATKILQAGSSMLLKDRKSGCMPLWGC